MGWRLPLDGFTRSAHRAPRIDFQADSPNAHRRSSPTVAERQRRGRLPAVVQRAVGALRRHRLARQLHAAERRRSGGTGWVGSSSRDSRRTGRTGRSGAWWPRDTRARASAPADRRAGAPLACRLFYRQGLQPLVDLAKGLRQLLPAHLGGGEIELTLHLGLGQPQRFAFRARARDPSSPAPSGPAASPVHALPSARRGAIPRRRALRQRHPWVDPSILIVPPSYERTARNRFSGGGKVSTLNRLGTLRASRAASA